jgi:hypothetical protein
MKIIIDTDLAAVDGAAYVDNITAIAASSEDAAFPASSLRNDHTTDIWRAVAGVTTAVLTAQVSKGSAVMVVNTNATSITVEAGTGASVTLETGWTLEDDWSMEDDAKFATLAYNLPGAGGRMWADYERIATAHIVRVTLIAAETVYAGIMRAGEVESFKNPAPGNNEGSADHSIVRRLNNGARYTRKRNVVRSFDGLSMVETRANCWKFKHGIWDAVGPKPLAVRLNDILLDDEFVVFACTPEGSPVQIAHDAGNEKSRVNFSLEEVV